MSDSGAVHSPDDEVRKCRVCGNEKSLREFRLTKSGSRTMTCQTCISDQAGYEIKQTHAANRAMGFVNMGSKAARSRR